MKTIGLQSIRDPVKPLQILILELMVDSGTRIIALTLMLMAIHHVLHTRPLHQRLFLCLHRVISLFFYYK